MTGVRLDIAACSPDDYEGRVLELGGAQYVIGEFLGQGAEKIVHRLVNARTKLSLLVIKIFRDQAAATEFGPRQTTRETELRDYFTTSVPNFIYERSHGGWFQIQDVFPFLPVEDVTSAGAQACQRMVEAADDGRFRDVLAHGAAVLKLNPYHSHALVDMALAHGHLGEPEQMLDLFETVIELEPNYCRYYLEYQKMAYLKGFPAIALNNHLMMLQRFPYQQDNQEVKAAAMISMGAPEQALQVLEETRRDLDEDAAAWVRTRARELRAARDRVQLMVAQARLALFNDDLLTARDHLRHAAEVNPDDPVLYINSTLLALRLGEIGAAGQLMSSLRYVFAHLHGPLVTAAALAEVDRQPDSPQARDLLRKVAMWAALPHAGGQPIAAASWLDGPDQLLCTPWQAIAASLVRAARAAREITGDATFDLLIEQYTSNAL